jgi:hypothetical protein
MTNKNNENANKYDGFAKKIYQGIRKAAIKFGDPQPIKEKEFTGQRWISNKLPSNAVVHFERILKNGKKNPRHYLKLLKGKEVITFSGKYARATLQRLTHEPKERKKVMSNEEQKLAKSLLEGI